LIYKIYKFLYQSIIIIITSIDNKIVKNSEEVTNYLKEKKGGVLIEGIYPNGMRAYYGFGM
jgi:hypothetical protein